MIQMRISSLPATAIALLFLATPISRAQSLSPDRERSASAYLQHVLTNLATPDYAPEFKALEAFALRIRFGLTDHEISAILNRADKLRRTLETNRRALDLILRSGKTLSPEDLATIAELEATKNDTTSQHVQGLLEELSPTTVNRLRKHGERIEQIRSTARKR